MVTRERKEAFIESFDTHIVEFSIKRAVENHGLSVFSDDALNDITSDLLRRERLRNRLNRENRARITS